MKICQLFKFNSHRPGFFARVADAKFFGVLLVPLIFLVATAQRGLCQAQSFPERTVTIVTPYAGGGLSFDFGHLIASRLEKEFRVPVVVESRPGGNAIVGTVSVVRS